VNNVGTKILLHSEGLWLSENYQQVKYSLSDLETQNHHTKIEWKTVPNKPTLSIIIIIFKDL